MRIFSCYRTDGLLWFRIFGKGLVIKNSVKHPPIFSERMGYRKGLKLGKYRIKFLK